MKKILSLLVAVLLSVAHLSAQSPNAATQVHARTFTNLFTAQSVTGQTASFDATGAAYHTINLVVTGAPSGCTYRLQGSLDAVTWFNISASDITCTSTVTTFESSAKVTRYVRGNLVTLTGGTAPTVTLQYGGY